MQFRLPLIRAALAALALSIAAPAAAAPAYLATTPAYHPITPNPEAERRTIVLTGHDLTIEDVIAVARHGAKLQFAPEAIARAEAGIGMLAQGNAEDIPIYGTNRGSGALRQVTVQRAEGDRLAGARSGMRNGALPEIDQEELVRAFLVIQANHWAYNQATPEYMNAMVAMINAQVTPVMYSRGTVGEGDLFLTSNYNATLVGAGQAYYKGQRMRASEALQRAGLKPITTSTGGGTTNSYQTALALMMVDEGRAALEWADVALGMVLNGMNSSVTPMVLPVQQRRPFPWVNWQAAKMLELVKGSYLFLDDKDRILQDAESIRASYIRLGSAWQAWADLRDAVTIQMNSGEQNPAIAIGAKPEDHWSLSTPWLMRYYIRGGPANGGRTGYVLSNANWDPYPMVNEIESFNVALANMAASVAVRIDRFTDRGPVAFFTAIKPSDVLTPEQFRLSPYMVEPFFTYLDVWKEMQMLTQSVPPDSSSSDYGVADLEAMGRLKASRGRQALDLFMQLLAHDVLWSTYWLDVRKAQDGTRQYGAPVTAAWSALRKDIPWQQEPDLRGDLPLGVVAYNFMMTNPARTFTAGAAVPAMPATLPLPRAD